MEPRTRCVALRFTEDEDQADDLVQEALPERGAAYREPALRADARWACGGVYKEEIL
jgi:DNA-directed RNA polymerase specialized sigma24 family protein